MRQGPRSQPTPLTRAVVAVLNEAMDEQGVSTHALALKVKGLVSRSQVYDVLADKRNMDLAELDAFCEALGLDVHAVLVEAQGRRQNPPTPPTTAEADVV